MKTFQRQHCLCSATVYKCLMPSCLSGWPGKHKSSSVFSSPLPQNSVKYSTLWAWFFVCFKPVRLQRELWIQCKKHIFYFFASAPMLHIWSINIQMSYLFSYCLDFFIEKQQCFSYIDFFLDTECYIHRLLKIWEDCYLCSLTHLCHCFLTLCHRLLIQIRRAWSEQSYHDV